jgi:hypothetical protein
VFVILQIGGFVSNGKTNIIRLFQALLLLDVLSTKDSIFFNNASSCPGQITHLKWKPCSYIHYFGKVVVSINMERERRVRDLVLKFLAKTVVLVLFKFNNNYNNIE